MKHVVSYSGGLSSWYCGKWVAETYGRENTTLLFADTLIEDEDLYGFLAESAGDIGVPLTVVCDGRTPWEVFEDRRLIGNHRRDPCSEVLKRNLLDKWRRDNCTPEDSIHYIGLGWWEPTRVERLPARFAPWRVEMPLATRFDIDPQVLLEMARACGLPPPRLYELGFPHNNCGGFCVKAGQAKLR